MLDAEEMAELLVWHLERGAVELATPGRRGARAARDVEGRLLRGWLDALRPGRAGTATEARVLWRDRERQGARELRECADGSLHWHVGDGAPPPTETDRAAAVAAIDAVRAALAAAENGAHEAMVDRALVRAAGACRAAALAHGRDDVIGPLGFWPASTGVRIYGERARVEVLRDAINRAAAVDAQERAWCDEACPDEPERDSPKYSPLSRSRMYQIALLVVAAVTEIPEGVLRTTRRDRSHTV